MLAAEARVGLHTRIPYDQAGKKLLDGALEGAGTVESQHEVSTESQWFDVWFEPRAKAEPVQGVLGRMTTEACAFELFHEAPTVATALDCHAKLLAKYQQRKRGARTRASETGGGEDERSTRRAVRVPRL